MTDFFDLPLAAQLETMERAARAALPLWDLGQARIELIKYRENAVFKVISAAGDCYALRVHRLGYHSDAELRSELQWMSALNEAGIQTPPVVPAADGSLFHSVSLEGASESLQIDILQWVEGEPLGTIEEGASLKADALNPIYRKIGVMAARTHNHAETWQRPAGFTRHAWDLEGLTGGNPFWGRFWELEALSVAQAAMLGKVRLKLRAELEAFGTGGDRFGLVHADFLPENFLVAGDEIRLIDFDDAGFGWHLFDLATSLFFHLGEDYFDDLVAALVEGYRVERSLPDDHLQKLPLFLLVRGTTYLGWAHSRKETETAQELTPMLVASVCRLAEEYLLPSSA